MGEKIDPHSMAQLMALANSPAGKELMALLQQSAGDDLRQAAKKASAGDIAGAKDLISPALNDPRIQALLRQMGGQ